MWISRVVAAGGALAWSDVPPLRRRRRRARGDTRRHRVPAGAHADPHRARLRIGGRSLRRREETYRAYVDALNQVDLSDPETFEAVYAWTTGEANAGEKKSLTQWLQRVVSHRGFFDSRFFPDVAKLAKPATVSAIVCSDVSDVVVTDASGQSMVSGQRPDVYALRIDLIEDSNTSTGLAIATSNAIEDARCTS